MRIEISPVVWARSLAWIGAAAFILCFIWGSLLSDPKLQEFHLTSLRIYLLDLGFVGSNFTTLIVGAIVSAVWGATFGAALGLCLNHCNRKANDQSRLKAERLR